MNEGDYKTLWISTAPRTGSMWLFNVCREVLRASGNDVFPEVVPQSDEAMFRLAQEDAWKSEDPRHKWVLTVHHILRPDLPLSKIITTHRDPRDVIVSFRQFMKTDFEAALGCGRWVTRFTHVSARKTGDWQAALSESERQRVNEEFADCVREYGYES